MAASEPRSSTASFPPEPEEGASADCHWQRDEDVDACPRCQQTFTTTLRRHHCRQCGGVYCDECSRSRMRLAKGPSWGKVRVCDGCAAELSERQASGFEEDLDVSKQIIAQLRASLVVRYAECEAFKRILLELDAAATNDSQLLERYEGDPESDEYSFNTLKKRLLQRWACMRATLLARPARQRELTEQGEQARAQQSAAMENELRLRERYSELDTQLGQVARIEGERDELVRRRDDLAQAVADTRARVRELESERQAFRERQAAFDASAEASGSARCCGRVCGMRQADARQDDEAGHGQVPYMIALGRSDSLGGASFQQQERRACVVM